MPQMAPLMWLNILTSTFVVIAVLMVYSYFFKNVNFNAKENSFLTSASKKWLW
uniref:ATP synthase F0 subunit 8 n=1 Tax=Caprella penantis TaxID=1282972 RepID=UPI0023D7C076|nr:ATP synthase F0 subunit 8 [Caprella penantis]WCR50876.1 ATP synthase F0 subunit 8 [Caprella penantis]